MFRKPAITWPPAIFEWRSQGWEVPGPCSLKFYENRKKNDGKTSTHFAYIKLYSISHEPFQIFFGDATTTCLFPEGARILLGASPN